MRKLTLLSIAALFLCAACSPVLYQQIATLESENVKLQNDGAYVYEDAAVVINYDFWSEYGKFSFVVTNNSDDNLYLILSDSYFINNGFAYDYYKGRKFISTSRSTTTIPASSTRYSSQGRNLSVSPAEHRNSQADAQREVIENGSSVEIEEQAIVCIPAHSSKSFKDFSISTSVYRECGFVRDPNEKETAVRKYTGFTSPQIIENRLVFRMGETVFPVNNTFYVKEYQNISYDDATEYVKNERCNGTKYDVLVHKMAASNKFYITYGSADLWEPSGRNDDRAEARDPSARDQYWR